MTSVSKSERPAIDPTEAQQWLESYNRDGYLVVENAVDPQSLAELQQAMDEIEERYKSGELPPQLRRWISTDHARSNAHGLGGGSDQISNVMELPLFGRPFQDLIINPRILDILETLFQSPEFAFHNYKCICKMPHNDTPFQWHRDYPYLQHTSPDLLTCMVCLDDMTESNGATVVCPGTHRISQEEVRDSDRNIPESEVPHPRTTVVCPAGSAVLFHVNIVHGGGPNKSDSKRRNAISIWSGPGCLPITPYRYAYEFIRPRSRDPLYRKQIEMTFGS